MQRWKNRENVHNNSRIEPPGEFTIVLATEKAYGPAAAATSHATSRMEPMLKAIPVMRWLIDSTEVSWGR